MRAGGLPRNKQQTNPDDGKIRDSNAERPLHIIKLMGTCWFFSSEHDSLHKAWGAIHFLKNVAIVWGTKSGLLMTLYFRDILLRAEPQTNEDAMILINEGKNKLVLTISSRASVSFLRGGSNCSLSTTKHYIFKFNTHNIIPVPFQCLLQ